VGDDEFDKIFVVMMPSPGETRVLRLRYGAPRVGSVADRKN